jgi:hypothetical protein
VARTEVAVDMAVAAALANVRLTSRQGADSLWKLDHPPGPGLARLGSTAVAGFRANQSEKDRPAQAGPFFLHPG